MINSLHFSYDSLTIHDGDSTSSPILGTYCGNTIPPNHFSSGNEVLLHLDSDGSVTYTGFQLEHQQLGMSKLHSWFSAKWDVVYLHLPNSIWF